ncbi:MAG: Crp/Fnr family transcriptional regulator, partial [Bacteroidota bacterium]
MIREIKIVKGQFLQKEGEYNTKGYIVKSGLLRSYSIDAKGKEHIFMFAPENWIIADTTPPHLPSELYIDALEDTLAIVFKKGEEDNPDVQKLFSRLNVLQKRIIMLMSASSIERYEHFIETYP